MGKIMTYLYTITKPDGTVENYIQQTGKSIYINYCKSSTGEGKLFPEGKLGFTLTQTEYDEFLGRLSEYIRIEEEK